MSLTVPGTAAPIRSLTVLTVVVGCAGQTADSTVPAVSSSATEGESPAAEGGSPAWPTEPATSAAPSAAPTASAAPDTPGPRHQIFPGRGSCTTDADCVPAECCHPRQCVSQALAPPCQDVVCTHQCVPGTMDCNGGSCVCNENTCAARLRVHSAALPSP